MSAGLSQAEVGGAGVVREAAGLSLSERGVRVYRTRVREADGGWTDPWSWELGVADPAARSIQVRHFNSEESLVNKLAEASARFFGAANQTTDHSPEEVEAQSIEIERQRYHGGPERWIDRSDRPSYGPARGLWPLEAILATTTASPAAGRDVRGQRCARYICKVVPGSIAGQAAVKLVDLPKPDDDWRALDADVSIDRSGLVRRIAWSPMTGKRLKAGLLGRLLRDRQSSDAGTPSSGRLWNIIEFWDYGCEVEIAAPTDLISEGTPIRQIARDLRRMRHQSKRRAAGSG